ncbi:MAG TPA: hypothetical protein VGM44_01150 [Polyangiaceae bacterium]|jgi:hypothetical protein
MLRVGPHSARRGPVYGTVYGPTRAFATAALLALAATCATKRAHADHEVAELSYERPSELEACPDENAFRRAVIARLGRDPFVVGAARKISVRLTQSGATLSAIVHVDEAGSVRGERRIDTRSGCEELASGAALAVSIAIDPLAALGPPAEPESATKPSASTTNPPAPSTKPKPAPANPKPLPVAKPASPRAPDEQEAAVNRGFVRAGGRAWLNAVPGASAGPTIGLGYQRGLGSIALDGIFVLPQAENVAGTRRAVSVALLAAEFSPCAHFDALRLCALLDAGALLARGQGVAVPSSGAKFDLSAGAGLGYSFFVGHFSFTPELTASARLTKTELDLDGTTVWTTPRGLGSFGLELGYDFFR